RCRGGWSCGVEPHHPVATRHPSSTRRGMFCALPSSWRRAGRDSVAEGGLTANPKPTPPRRFAPPLLDEEGNVLHFALLVEEGRTRQCRGGWSYGKPKTHTTPTLRATPPRRGGEMF